MATFQKLPSGKWRAIVRRKGVSKTASFEKKGQARDWATRIESMITQSQTGLISSAASLGQLIEKFTRETVAKGKTRRRSLITLQKELGHLQLNRLTQIHIQAWADKRMKAAGASTVAAYMSFLAKVLDWGRNTKRLDVTGDMARAVRSNLSHAGHSTRSATRDRIPTQDELDRLYDHWKIGYKIPMETITRFAIVSCMRQSEITGLLLEDVDVENQTVIVRERKDPRNKQSNDQVVPLFGEAWDIVQARLGNKGRLFPYNPASVSAAWRRSCKKLGIKDLRFHDCRHAGITDLFRKGLPIQLVSIVSGHKDWSNLKRYTQLNAADVHAALK